MFFHATQIMVGLMNSSSSQNYTDILTIGNELGYYKVLEPEDVEYLKITRTEREFIIFVMLFSKKLNLEIRTKEQHLHNMLIMECAKIIKKLVKLN